MLFLNVQRFVALFAAITGLFLQSTRCDAVIIFDNFDTDTSANYTGSDSFGTGGAFSIDAGDSNVLRVATGITNTFSVVNTLSMLDVGESFSIDVPTYGSNDGVFAILSTGLGQPDGTSVFGFRLRLDTESNFRLQTFSSGGNTLVDTGVSNPKTPMTVWVDRTSSTGFDFFYGPKSSRTFIYSDALAASDVLSALHVGVQAFGNLANSFDFDNLQISVVPEPSSFVLMMLGLAGYGLRRRKCHQLV